MPGHDARVRVEAAASATADDDAYALAFVKVIGAQGSVEG
jgi:hypothetical protein